MMTTSYDICARLRQIIRVLITILSLVDAKRSYTNQTLTKIKIGQYWLQLATTPQSRTKGLQGVKNIDKHNGMLFVYPTPTKAVYWMYRCYTSMDIIFLDKSGRVQGISSATPPNARELPPEQCLKYTIHGSMSTDQVRYITLPQTTYVVEVPLGEGTGFGKTSAYLVPSIVAAAKIKAN
jgi:uncharacterized membrane protein (UPF0127 family)